MNEEKSGSEQPDITDRIKEAMDKGDEKRTKTAQTAETSGEEAVILHWIVENWGNPLIPLPAMIARLREYKISEHSIQGRDHYRNLYNERDHLQTENDLLKGKVKTLCNAEGKKIAPQTAYIQELHNHIEEKRRLIRDLDRRNDNQRQTIEELYRKTAELNETQTKLAGMMGESDALKTIGLRELTFAKAALGEKDKAIAQLTTERDDYQKAAKGLQESTGGYRKQRDELSNKVDALIKEKEALRQKVLVMEGHIDRMKEGKYEGFWHDHFTKAHQDLLKMEKAFANIELENVTLIKLLTACAHGTPGAIENARKHLGIKESDFAKALREMSDSLVKASGAPLFRSIPILHPFLIPKEADWGSGYQTGSNLVDAMLRACNQHIVFAKDDPSLPKTAIDYVAVIDGLKKHVDSLKKQVETQSNTLDSRLKEINNAWGEASRLSSLYAHCKDEVKRWQKQSEDLSRIIEQKNLQVAHFEERLANISPAGIINADLLTKVRNDAKDWMKLCKEAVETIDSLRGQVKELVYDRVEFSRKNLEAERKMEGYKMKFDSLHRFISNHYPYVFTLYKGEL